MSEQNKMKVYPLICSITFLSLSIATATLADKEIADTIIAGSFSTAHDLSRLPENWEPLEFKDIDSHTSYQLVRENDKTVIKADSKASSSGITRKMTVNPLDHPFLSWSWKVTNIYEKGDVSTRDGDDYPARIYITFAYDADKVDFWDRVKYNTIKLFYGEYPPINAINYIWASKASKELITPNPYTDKVQMIVVESGDDRLNTWVTMKRNIAEDYRKAFGEEPPVISGIALMTDSDNTGESATAWYGDIVFTSQ